MAILQFREGHLITSSFSPLYPFALGSGLQYRNLGTGFSKLPHSLRKSKYVLDLIWDCFAAELNHSSGPSQTAAFPHNFARLPGQEYFVKE
jgi:hypothetical protein